VTLSKADLKACRVQVILHIENKVCIYIVESESGKGMIIVKIGEIEFHANLFDITSSVLSTKSGERMSKIK